MSNRRERTGLIPVGRWFNLALQRQTRKAPIKNRPTSVTVFGILNIVFAGFSLFAVFATITLFSMEVSSNNPVVKLLHENRALAFWLRVSILLGLVNCLVLVVSGSACSSLSLGRACWRSPMVVYAIVVGLFNIGINFAFVVRPLLEQAKTQNNTEAAGAAAGAIGGEPLVLVDVSAWSIRCSS